MTQLARNYGRPHKVHDRAINIAPINAGEKLYVGGYLLREAATGLATKVVAEGNVPLGVIVEQLFPDDPDKSMDEAYDNTTGSDGVLTNTLGNEVAERCVRYDRKGEYLFLVEGGTPKVEGLAYLVDDNTTSPVETAEGVIAGHYTRPGPLASTWYVDIEQRSTLA